MLKHLALACALSAQCAGGTLAQTLDNPADCMNIAADLTASAEAKGMPDEQIDKVDELLVKMEQYCDAHRYSEAMDVLANVKVMIEKQ
jgi:hypothetical protein